MGYFRKKSLGKIQGQSQVVPQFNKDDAAIMSETDSLGAAARYKAGEKSRATKVANENAPHSERIAPSAGSIDQVGDYLPRSREWIN